MVLCTFSRPPTLRPYRGNNHTRSDHRGHMTVFLDPVAYPSLFEVAPERAFGAACRRDSDSDGEAPDLPRETFDRLVGFVADRKQLLYAAAIDGLAEALHDAMPAWFRKALVDAASAAMAAQSPPVVTLEMAASLLRPQPNSQSQATPAAGTLSPRTGGAASHPDSIVAALLCIGLTRSMRNQSMHTPMDVSNQAQSTTAMAALNLGITAADSDDDAVSLDAGATPTEVLMHRRTSAAVLHASGSLALGGAAATPNPLDLAPDELATSPGMRRSISFAGTGEERSAVTIVSNANQRRTFFRPEASVRSFVGLRHQLAGSAGQDSLGTSTSHAYSAVGLCGSGSININRPETPLAGGEAYASADGLDVLGARQPSSPDAIGSGRSPHPSPLVADASRRFLATMGETQRPPLPTGKPTSARTRPPPALLSAAERHEGDARAALVALYCNGRRALVEALEEEARATRLEAAERREWGALLSAEVSESLAATRAAHRAKRDVAQAAAAEATRGCMRAVHAEADARRADIDAFEAAMLAELEGTFHAASQDIVGDDEARAVRDALVADQLEGMQADVRAGRGERFLGNYLD